MTENDSSKMTYRLDLFHEFDPEGGSWLDNFPKKISRGFTNAVMRLFSREMVRQFVSQEERPYNFLYNDVPYWAIFDSKSFEAVLKGLGWNTKIDLEEATDRAEQFSDFEAAVGRRGKVVVLGQMESAGWFDGKYYLALTHFNEGSSFHPTTAYLRLFVYTVSTINCVDSIVARNSLKIASVPPALYEGMFSVEYKNMIEYAKQKYSRMMPILVTEFRNYFFP